MANLSVRPKTSSVSLFSAALAAAAVGVLVALGYVYYSQASCGTWCEEMHVAIIDGSAAAPFRFRVLSAWIAEAMPGGVALGYALAHLLVAPATWAACWLWLEGEVGRRRALIGVVLMAAAMLVGYRMYGIALYSLMELGLVAAALLILRYRSPDVWYALLVVLGTLNRETTGALMVLAVVATGGRPYALAAVWMTAMVGLRLMFGAGTDGQSILDILQGNLIAERLLPAFMNHAALLPFAALAGMGWKEASPMARRRLLVMGIPYAGAVLVFGFWDEVRLWLPALMLALPIIVGESIHERD